MSYDDLINKVIKNDEIQNLLCGKKPYQVEVSKFASDVFPTDINAVLVNCIISRKSTS